MRIGTKTRRCWPTRRGALAVASSLAIAMGLTPSFAREPAPADLLLKSGQVYKVDGSRRTVEALAVKNGRLAFVGSNAAVEAFIGRMTIVEDAGGNLVLPGLSQDEN
jgi:hypothetical protein